jgi:hypothetical protein
MRRSKRVKFTLSRNDFADLSSRSESAWAKRTARSVYSGIDEPLLTDRRRFSDPSCGVLRASACPVH